MTAEAWQPPSRIGALDFWWRSRLLVAVHALREGLRPTAQRWPAGNTLAAAPILLRHRTPLWSAGSQELFVLVAGKVHNLRIACRAFHAVEVPAGAVLSFWRQLGRPSAGRGYVAGRELRGGCIVPTRAGGLCQLSNALATAAAGAGFELVERHAHSRPVPGVTDGAAVDATVFWNYVDLRIRAAHGWRLEVEMSAGELVLTLRGHAPAGPAALRSPLPLRAAPVEAPVALRSCLDCDERGCFRHRPPERPVRQGRTAWLLDGWTPEWARHLGAPPPEVDRFVPLPLRLAFWRRAARGWPREGAAVVARWASLKRALWQRRWARHSGGRRQASLIEGAGLLAAAYAARLRPEHTHLVIDQALLPHLAALGVLGGRHYEVLATALPMHEIEARLDAAARRWPEEATLRDFRAGAALAAAEARALAGAQRLVTAHHELAARAAACTAAPVTLLDWELPPAPAAAPSAAGARRPVIVLAAPPLARKGARELAEALHGLARPPALRVLGEAPAGRRPSRWQGLDVQWVGPAGAWLADACAVVLPAHVEHAPRALLRALAAGVPVIASAACGLGQRPGVRTVPAGDICALREALREILSA